MKNTYYFVCWLLTCDGEVFVEEKRGSFILNNSFSLLMPSIIYFSQWNENTTMTINSRYTRILIYFPLFLSFCSSSCFVALLVCREHDDEGIYVDNK